MQDFKNHSFSTTLKIQKNQANIFFKNFILKPFVYIGHEYGKKYILIYIKDRNGKFGGDFFDVCVKKDDISSAHYNTYRFPEDLKDIIFKIYNFCVNNNYQEPSDLPLYFLD